MAMFGLCLHFVLFFIQYYDVATPKYWASVRMLRLFNLKVLSFYIGCLVGTLSPFSGTSIKNYDVMTSKRYLNITTQLICMNGST